MTFMSFGLVSVSLRKAPSRNRDVAACGPDVAMIPDETECR
jgi:hypothetical protein